MSFVDGPRAATVRAVVATTAIVPARSARRLRGVMQIASNDAHHNL
jgi:hypothetical protein